MSQQDPNAKTDAVKVKERRALVEQAAKEKREREEKEAQRRAEGAGGVGMISQQPAPEAEDRKVVPAEPTRFLSAEFKRNQFVLDASAGARPEDLKDPAFWAHIGEKLTPWAEIMVRADDGLWYARVIVLEAGRNFARVHVENVSFLTTADVAMSRADQFSPYEVTYRGPHNQWSVIRKSDRAVVHEGAQTEGQAYEWLRGRRQADR